MVLCIPHFGCKEPICAPSPPKGLPTEGNRIQDLDGFLGFSQQLVLRTIPNLTAHSQGRGPTGLPAATCCISVGPSSSNYHQTSVRSSSSSHSETPLKQTMSDIQSSGRVIWLDLDLDLSRVKSSRHSALFFTGDQPARVTIFHGGPKLHGRPFIRPLHGVPSSTLRRGPTLHGNMTGSRTSHYISSERQ